MKAAFPRGRGDFAQRPAIPPDHPARLAHHQLDRETGGIQRFAQHEADLRPLRLRRDIGQADHQRAVALQRAVNEMPGILGQSRPDAGLAPHDQRTGCLIPVPEFRVRGPPHTEIGLLPTRDGRRIRHRWREHDPVIGRLHRLPSPCRVAQEVQPMFWA